MFANINATEFKRMISNLLNNAIEAMAEGKGKVVVAIRAYPELVSVIVQDNGKGIPQHILDQLGQEGVTHGKEGTQSGSGLGVYHAKKTVESFKGKFGFSSREGVGTTISMNFPRAQAPSWFVEKLSFIPPQQVISVDDDLSIHGIWKGRFESKRLGELGLEHLTFTSGEEFQNWFLNHPEGQAERLYLVDFELLNQKRTGLEIIEQLGIGKQSVLVTSRYEEDKIREKCEQLGVRLIPKGMAGFVPMEIKKTRVKYDAFFWMMIFCWRPLGCPVTWDWTPEKKEKIGNFINQGEAWRKKGDPLKVNAYEFESLAKGKTTIYGALDLSEYEGFVNFGMSADIAEFA